MTARDRIRAINEGRTPGPWSTANPPDGPGEAMVWGGDGWTVANTFMFDNEEYIRTAREKGREPYDSLIIRRPDAQWRADARAIVAWERLSGPLLDLWERSAREHGFYGVNPDMTIRPSHQRAKCSVCDALAAIEAAAKEVPE